MCVDGDVIKWEVGERKVGFPSKRGDEWRVSGSLSGLKVISVTIKIYKQIPKCHYSVAATVAVISNDPVRKKKCLSLQLNATVLTGKLYS